MEENNIEEEIWKSIPGFEGYEVNNSGGVRSFYIYDRRLRAYVLTETHNTLNHYVSKQGYHYYWLAHFRKFKRAHALVLAAFVGPRPYKAIIRHLDGNPSNNKLYNLKYGSQKENVRDSIIHGTFPKGSNRGSSKLDEEKVLNIKKLLSNGSNCKDISAMLGVSQSTIVDIKNSIKWIHVPWPEGNYKIQKRISDEQALEIKKLLCEGLTPKQCAEKVGCTPKIVFHIRAGNSFSHVPWPQSNKIPKAKKLAKRLDEKVVKLVKFSLAMGMPVKECTDVFNVNRSVILDIKSEKSFKKIPWPIPPVFGDGRRKK